MRMAKSYTILMNRYTRMIIKIKIIHIFNSKIVKKKTLHKIIIFKTPL